MKIFKFIVSKIFLRKVILGIGIMLLLLMANYITFTAARSILSTFQGYQETKYVNQEGVYIANLDPDSPIDMGMVDENGTRAVYDYLNSNFEYAFYTDGFIVSVPNSDNMEISLGYMNEQYYRLNEFELSQGTDLYFDYQLDGEIPVLIGKTSLDKGIQGKEAKKVLPTLHKTPPNRTIGGVFVCGGKSLNPGPPGYAAPIVTRRYLQAWQTKPRPTPRRKRRAALLRRSRRNKR